MSIEQIVLLTYFLSECFGIDSMQGLVGDLSLEVVHLALQPVDLILQQPFLVLDFLHVVLKLILLVVLGISQTLDLLGDFSRFFYFFHKKKMAVMAKEIDYEICYMFVGPSKRAPFERAAKIALVKMPLEVLSFAVVITSCSSLKVVRYVPWLISGCTLL